MLKKFIEGFAFSFTLTAGVTLILILGVLWITIRTIPKALEGILSL
jgi:hypothetical protein